MRRFNRNSVIFNRGSVFFNRDAAFFNCDAARHVATKGSAKSRYSRIHAIPTLAD